MANISKKVSKAPAEPEAKIAEGETETNAVAVIDDAAAPPPGFSVPGGTNTAESASGAAAGPASAGPVKPLGEEPTKGMVPEAASPSMPGISPEAEAAASGINSTDASQGAAEPGAGNSAGSGDTPAFFGVDLAQGPDVGAISLGRDLSASSDVYPLTFAFLSSWAESETKTMPTGIRVTSKTDGFRRGGVAHSASGVTLLVGEFTPEQLEAFLGEPELTVEVAE